MPLQDDVNAILVALEAKHQRCTYNAMATFLGISLPSLFSALGQRRPHASWIVNQKTLKPTKYTKAQEHPYLYDNPEVISSDQELATFLGQVAGTPEAEPVVTYTETACYGVDGCKGGWLFANILGGELSFGTVPNVGDLVEKVADGSHIFIDIPIGLRSKSADARLCDQEARQILKPRRTSSVFNAPIRELLSAEDYASANALSKRLINKGISKQSFNIMDKIREVDGLLQGSSKARALVREVHPEVCFWAIAEGNAMKYGKKTEEGFKERLEYIQRYLPNAGQTILAALDHYPRSYVAKDDILDAVVAAITAAHPERWATLPAAPDLDATGLPMEMVYLK
ncbi:DUF429 domain-containing protein [Seongchinamella unica]|uniref:DUF429 domain-containing protein n=1 Tax=Seongchinamella unica TaxID=2547392 RepID=A0A4R5LNB1_9GAMM|nr:DUF429 domain-containing protein [Seongchinamella unica]TDG11660.1 DUF429 domain-containing protein [Seongchinamella unica]